MHIGSHTPGSHAGRPKCIARIGLHSGSHPTVGPVGHLPAGTTNRQWAYRAERAGRDHPGCRSGWPPGAIPVLLENKKRMKLPLSPAVAQVSNRAPSPLQSATPLHGNDPAQTRPQWTACFIVISRNKSTPVLPPAKWFFLCWEGGRTGTPPNCRSCARRPTERPRKRQTPGRQAHQTG